MESMLQMPMRPLVQMPPVGFQIVRDPNTGQCIFYPTPAPIGMNFNCFYVFSI